MSWSTLKSQLTTDEVRHLIQWFEESHTEGWKPRITVPASDERLFQKIQDLREKHEVGQPY